MAINKQHLAQSRPANTSAASILSPIEDQIIIIQDIIICNTTTSSVYFRIFLDNDGTTYSEVTAIVYDHELAANDMMILSFGQDSSSGLYMNNPSGNLAIRSSTSLALTFTVNGAIMVSG